MDHDIAIPKVIEGYATSRIVWFGGFGDAKINGADPFSRLAQIAAANSGGSELSTNGESDIASFSTSKDTAAPAGVCSLQLLPRRDYLNMMQPDDVLLVYGRADKIASEVLIMMVSIDTIHESRSVSGSGATLTRVSVNGRDLGKILMETPTIYDAAFGGLVMRDFYAQFLAAFTTSAARGGPSVVVQTMLAIYYSLKQDFVTLAIGQKFNPTDLFTTAPTDPKTTPLTPFRFPGNQAVSLFSFIDTSSFVQTPMVGAMQQKDEPTLLQNAANLWSLCDMYANRLVNEFFIDTRDFVPGFDDAHKRAAYFAGKFLAQFGNEAAEQSARINALSDATQLAAQTTTELLRAPDIGPLESTIALVHRQLPYDTMSFYSLPTSVVYETEVFTSDVGVSSADVKNIFRLRFPGLVDGASADVFTDLQFGVTINRDSISKHGLRRFEGESIYFWTNEISSPASIVIAYQPTYEFFLSLVTTWYAYNERLLSGPMTLRFRPDIRVGTRLTFVQTKTSYRTNVPSGLKTYVTDFYVQSVQHSFSPKPTASRTTLQLVRGIVRDGLSVQPVMESHLFWTDQGGSLDPDPYEIVQSEDLFSSGKSPDSVATTVVAPGDP